MKLPICLLAAGLLSACAADIATLQPAPEARLVAAAGMGKAAFDEAAGVRVTAMPRSWPGRTPIERVVTPVRLRIDNNSGQAVLVRYDRIALSDASGRVYAALPPYSIDATVSVPRLVPGHPVLIDPGFAGHGFAVSPLYAPAFPRLPTVAGPYLFDPLYYDRHGGYWRNVTVPLPTREMLRLALPEGSIAAGGSADGFVYFEEVGTDAQRVQMRVELVSAGSGNAIGTAAIPFVVTAQR